MTDEERTNIDRIERDRRNREALLLLLLLGFGTRALLNARSAIRIGSDPVQAAVDAIAGARHIDSASLAVRALPILTETYYRGLWRAGKMAGVKLDIPQNAPAPQSVIDAAWELEQRTIQAVRRVANVALAESMKTQQRTRAFLQSASDAFRAAGLTGDNPYGMELAAERMIVTTHGGGMWEGFTATPTVAEKVVGFAHRTILDGRETEICHDRAGLMLPSSDNYWRLNWPSLHFGCRSIILPLFKEQEWATEYPQIPPAPGFGRAPATAFGVVIGRAA